jgi:hypothetical protein
MAIVLVHATKAQLAAEFRQRYRDARGVEAGRLAAKLIAWYEAGDLTVTQIRTVFDLDTTAKWDAFRIRTQTLAAKYAELLASQGE